MKMENKQEFSEDIIHKIEDLLQMISTNTRKLDEITYPDFQLEKEKLQKDLAFSRIYLQQIQNLINEEEKGRKFSQFKKISEEDVMLKLGLFLINKRKFHKVKKKIPFIFSITLGQWEQLSKMLFRSNKMRSVLYELKYFYNRSIDIKVDSILQNLPIQINPELKERFRLEYSKKPLTFEEFMQQINAPNISTLQNQEELVNSADLRKNYEKALERKKILEKKQEQLESFDNYEQYFSMSERELKRAKRKGTMRRKYQKKSRRGKN
ncbi:MAG: hypothetical protein ACTSWC_01340 [Promethearchaeota archaeon]